MVGVVVSEGKQKQFIQMSPARRGGEGAAELEGNRRLGKRVFGGSFVCFLFLCFW